MRPLTFEEAIKLGKVITWRDAAIADGWTCEPIYPSRKDVAPPTQSVILKKDGFIAHVYLPGDSFERCGNVSVWGADGLVVKAPETYSMEKLVAGLNVCNECHKNVPQTVRLSFAGRVCPECRTRLAPTVEAPGWCD